MNAFGRVDYTKIGRQYNLAPIGISTASLISILSKECNRASQKGAGKIMLDKSPFVAAVSEPNKPPLCRFGGGRTSSVYPSNINVIDLYLLSLLYKI